MAAERGPWSARPARRKPASWRGLVLALPATNGPWVRPPGRAAQDWVLPVRDDGPATAFGKSGRSSSSQAFAPPQRGEALQVWTL